MSDPKRGLPDLTQAIYLYTDEELDDIFAKAWYRADDLEDEGESDYAAGVRDALA